MADKSASSPVVANSGDSTPATTGSPKKAAAKATKPRATATHPKTAEMVNAAIVALKERGGSSLQAIKKYMVGTYKVDAEKQATFIKKYLKAAVASGALVQTKGKGAAGSFKIGKVKTEKPKVKAVAKPKSPKKSPAAKKPAAAKKASATAAKKTPPKKATAPAVSPKKKAASKGPAAKPPKPKTTKAKPAPAAAKSPAKKSKPTSPKKAKTAAAPKKAATKKAVAAKK